MSESQFQTILRLTEQLKVARDNYEHVAKERDDLRRRIDAYAAAGGRAMHTPLPEGT